MGGNMNNKGFTLIELLGVVAVLGIIAIITVPVINRSLSQSKENLYDVQIEQIKKGCQDYYSEHLSELPENNALACKTIEELQKGGYLPLDIKNPKTNDLFDVNMRVCVKRSNNKKLEYIIYEE